MYISPAFAIIVFIALAIRALVLWLLRLEKENEKYNRGKDKK